MHQVDALDRSRNGILVYLAPSGVCDGVGVFAKRDLDPGSFVTAYAGVQKTAEARRKETSRPRRKSSSEGGGAAAFRKSCYIYVTDDGTALNGALPGNSRWTRYGLAHMANDAIDAHLTGGPDNNCEFKEVRVRRRGGAWRVYLKTARAVKAHEELLVPYGLDYWLNHLRSPHTSACREFVASLPRDTLHYLSCHLFVENRLGSRVDGLKLLHFHGYVTAEEDVLEMIYVVTYDDATAADSGSACTCTCMREDEMKCARWVVRLEAEEGGRRVRMEPSCTWCDGRGSTVIVDVSAGDHPDLFFQTIMSLRRNDL